MNYQKAQYNMIEQQIRPWNVLAQTTLNSLYQINRQDFVLEQYLSLAFSDCELPIGYGQTMLPPRVEAKFLQEIELSESDNVLEIGTGSGYMAALLATQANKVVSIEIIPELVAFAENNLRKANINNVKVVNDNFFNHQIPNIKFDAIVVSGAINKESIHYLEKYLSAGGRLIAVVGKAPTMQALLVTNSLSSGDFSYEILFETVLASLTYPISQSDSDFIF